MQGIRIKKSREVKGIVKTANFILNFSMCLKSELDGLKLVCTFKCEETKPVLKSGVNAVEKGRYKKSLTRIQEGKNTYNGCGNIKI